MFTLLAINPVNGKSEVVGELKSIMFFINLLEKNEIPFKVYSSGVEISQPYLGFKGYEFWINKN